MKTKDLIKALQEADPTGEIEVCDNSNRDIYFVEVQEAAYDGSLQTLIRDENKKPYYHIIGGKVWSSCKKLRLHTMGVEDIICNDPEVLVDLNDLKENMPTRYRDWVKRVEDWRQEVRDIENKLSGENN